MIHDILYSFFIALAVSAVSSLAKWIWKQIKESNATNERPHAPVTYYKKESIKRQFYISLILLIVSTAVFFTVIGSGNANSFPFWVAISLIGMAFGFIFACGAFDALLIVAPDKIPSEPPSDKSPQNPPKGRAKDDVQTKDTK